MQEKETNCDKTLQKVIEINKNSICNYMYSIIYIHARELNYT